MSRSWEETLGRAIRKTLDVDSTIGRTGENDEVLAAGFFLEVNPYFNRVKETRTFYDTNSLLWGSGNWNEKNWNTKQSFLLGAPGLATLGTNVLGGGTQEIVTNAVYNVDNCFLEPMHNNRFVDSGTTTCTVDYNNQKIDFNNIGEVFQSSVIARRQTKNITSIKLIVATNDYNIDNCIIYASNNGTNWANITEYLNKEYTFTTIGQDLYYKIVSSDSADWGSWGVWGASYVPQYIYTDETLLLFKVVYTTSDI